MPVFSIDSLWPPVRLTPLARLIPRVFAVHFRGGVFMMHFWFPLLAVSCALGLGMARVRADDKPKQSEKSFEKPVTILVKLKYLLYLPPKYEKGDEKYPLVIFLH